VDSIHLEPPSGGLRLSASERGFCSMQVRFAYLKDFKEVKVIIAEFVTQVSISKTHLTK
jgi:hypothetical protein